MVHIVDTDRESLLKGAIVNEQIPLVEKLRVKNFHYSK